MATLRHLHNVSGTWKTRVTVPVELRTLVGRRELVRSHGTDRNKAYRNHPKTVAEFLDRIDAARATRAALSGAQTPSPRNLDPAEAARAHYAAELALDQLTRDQAKPLGLEQQFRDGFEKALWRVVEGEAGDAEIVGVIQWAIDNQGERAPRRGTKEWRSLAQTLARTQVEVIRRQNELDQGKPTSAPTYSILTRATAPVAAKASIDEVFQAYMSEAKASGKGDAAERRWKPVVASLKAFVGHDDLARVSAKDATAWKSELIKQGLAPKTINDVYIAATKAIGRWAEENHHIERNPFASLRMKKETKTVVRERGFTDTEAKAILKACSGYVRPKRESEKIAQAKRWIPFLCAYTGARVGEMAQLTREHVYLDAPVPYLRITPEDGSVKTKRYRDVPLHEALIEAGFGEFVRDAPPGPLFATSCERKAAETTSGRVRDWVASLPEVPKEIQPNHAWRHRFKTVGREVGADSRVLDAIQGHAGRTAGDDYGDVTLVAKLAALRLFPTPSLD